MKKHLPNSLRVLCLSLAVLLSLPMLAAEVEIDGIKYDLNAEAKQAAVIKKSSGAYYSGSIVIPESVVYEGNAYSVTSIGDYAFQYCNGLTSVTIPNSVTSIGYGVFYNCDGLTSFVVEEGNLVYDSRNNCNAIVETASNSLICGCKTSIIPNSVTSIGDFAFYDCDGLTSVTIPNSVTSIGDYAFYYCSSLTSVTIGNSVTSIGDFAFWFCSGLTSVTIPNSVESIGESAFEYCRGLTSVSIGNSVTSIGDFAFYDCDGLTSVTIGNSVTSIGEEAFSWCSGLTSVTIPNSVKSIGDFAFYKCSGLTSVTIGNSVTSIGEDAFAYCPELLDVYCYAENVPSTQSDAFLLSPIADATLHVPASSVGSYEEQYPWSAFGSIVALPTTEVDGINYDFDAETQQATVIAKSSGKYSGEVVIPEYVEHEGAAYSVTSIGGNAFSSCSGLTSVTIGNSVTSIGAYAFAWCSGLTSIVVEDENPVYDSRNNCNAIIETATNTLHFGCKTTVIPNSVTSIGEKAFACSGLTSVTIPKSVTSIGFAAFHLCRGLTSVSIGNSVTSIGDYAFSICDGLTSVSIGNSVTSIGEEAFSRCPGLTSVTIGNSVTSIGERAFAYCPELLDVYCYAENVPSTVSDAFSGSYPENATLHVPATSVDSYKASAPWSSFGKITSISGTVTPLPDLTLTDGEEFENNTEQTLSTLTYTRTLPNLKWNALYVPFEIPVAEIADKYEVAYINDINSYDKNDDGAIDDMEMEIIKIKSGTLNANYPYLIKARNEEARNMSITLENATLYPTVSTTIDCSSVFAKHEVTGIYDRKYQNELPEGCMAISVNGAWQPIATGSYLNPFRLYMTVSARDGSPVKVEPAALSRIRISVLGEDDMETGIEDVKTENGEHKTVILDLSGRRVQNPEKGGVYIVNGKKVVY